MPSVSSLKASYKTKIDCDFDSLQFFLVTESTLQSTPSIFERFDLVRNCTQSNKFPSVSKSDIFVHVDVALSLLNRLSVMTLNRDQSKAINI